ncbi:MAG: large-conductance mechanosensitive channel protein MscL, partial [Parvimonas sp.]
MLKEFKEFALKGNVMDLAIGVIIGGAFGKIVTSLVNDVLMPLISMLTGGINFSDLKIVLKAGDEAKKIQEVAFKYGAFIQNIIDFLIIAFCIFMMVKALNKLTRKKE